MRMSMALGADPIRSARLKYSSSSRVKAHSRGINAPDDLSAGLYQHIAASTHNLLNDELRSKEFVDRVTADYRVTATQVRGYRYTPGQVIPSRVHAMGVKDEVKKFADTMKSKLDSIITALQDTPTKLSGIGGNVKRAADWAVGLGEDVVDWGQDAGSWVWDKTTDAGNYIWDKALFVGGKIQDLLNIAVAEYMKAKAGAGKVVDIIKAGWGGVERWTKEVLMPGVTGSSVTASAITKEGFKQMWVNFAKWLFDKVDRGLGWIIKAPLAAVILFWDKLGEQVSEGYRNLYRTSKARRVGGASVTAMSILDDYKDIFGSFDWKKISTALGQLRDLIVSYFGAMFNRVVNQLGKAIEEKGGKTTGLSGFADLDLIAEGLIQELVALEQNTSLSPGVKAIKRIRILLAITMKALWVTVKRVVINVIVPLLGVVADFIKAVAEQAIAFAVKISKPVGEFLLKVIMSPINIIAWFNFNRMNEVDKLRRIERHGEIGDTMKDPLAGDQIRNFGNLFGFQSDAGAFLLFVGTSAVIGCTAALTGAIAIEKAYRRWKYKGTKREFQEIETELKAEDPTTPLPFAYGRRA